MSMVFPKNFPDVFLRVQLWAVTWQIVHFHLVTRILHEFCDRVPPVIWRPIKNENQVAIGRSTKSDQKGTKSLLREVGQLHPIAKPPGIRDGAKGFDAFVASESAALRRLSDARPRAVHGALRRQRHFIRKENRGGFPPGAPRNPRLAVGFPAVLRGGVRQSQDALGFLDTKAPRPQQLGHVVRVIADPKMRAEDRSHPSRIPHVVREAGRQGPSLNQLIEQHQFFFPQFCRAPRPRLCQQAFIPVAVEIANPVGNGATSDAEANRYFPIGILAPYHNQTANPQHDIPGSAAFRFCRELFQIAQTAVAQLQFFTRASHWYPPYSHGGYLSWRVCLIIYA